MRNSLVLVQISLSLVLLVGAGLFVRSLGNASRIDIGFREPGVVSMSFNPSLHHYTPEKTRAFMAQLQTRVAALPGVRSVAFVDILPLSIGGAESAFRGAGANQQPVHADMYQTGGRFFEVLGMPLLRGRAFRAGGNNGRTAVINEAMAHQLFGIRDPLGEMVYGEGAAAQGYQVIGVVRNAKSRTLGEKAAACVWFPLDTPSDVNSI